MKMFGPSNRTLRSAGATCTQPLTRKVVAASSSMRRQVVATQARFGGKYLVHGTCKLMQAIVVIGLLHVDS